MSDPNPPQAASRTAETLALARDIIRDLESAEVAVEAVLRKAMRLARLVESEISIRWLALELNGYAYAKDCETWSQTFGRGMVVSSVLTEFKFGETAPLTALDAEREELTARC